MDDRVLDQVLDQLSQQDLRRAYASCARHGDTELVAILEQRLGMRADRDAQATRRQ